MKKNFLKTFAIGLCLMLCMAVMTVNIFGYAPIDSERKTSLTLTFGMGETAFSGVKFQVYRVVDEDTMEPVAQKTTDEEGVVTFAGLQNGVYLVEGESYYTETEIYTPVSFQVSLPQLVPEADTWDYEVVANIKYTVTSEQLPQTGLLWWPAWLLVPGSILLIAGVMSLRRKEERVGN